MDNTMPTFAPTSRFHDQDVLPALESAFEHHGYEMGYSRGVTDVLATMLEAADEFSARQGDVRRETLQMLFAFSEFLEQKIDRKTVASAQVFSDGSGI